MTDEQRLQKNRQIKETRRATAVRRQSQFPLTFTLKVRNERRNIKNNILSETITIMLTALLVVNTSLGKSFRYLID